MTKPIKKKRRRRLSPKTRVSPTSATSAASHGVSSGRPTKFKATFVAVAKAMCQLGATDADLAAELDVDTSTIWRWRSKHRAFGAALKAGKDLADDRVERALYQRAVGYSYDSLKIMAHEGRSFEHAYTEHVPPDPGAAKLWLTNRRPKDWRERQVVEHEVPAFREFIDAMHSGKFAPKPFDPREDDDV